MATRPETLALYKAINLLTASQRLQDRIVLALAVAGMDPAAVAKLEAASAALETSQARNVEAIALQAAV